jgi:hypothetical protein
VVRLVRLCNEIGDRELYLARASCILLVVGAEPEVGREVAKNVGSLRNDEIAVFEERRGKWG